MIEEEKLSLEEQRINDSLCENFDRSKWPGITPNSFPPEMVEGWLTLEQFNAMQKNAIKKIMKEKYGYVID